MGNSSNVISIDKARKPKAKTKTPKVLQLKITLNNSKPPIWRRVQVSNDLTLDRLHYIIQVCMGWEDCHLHEFQCGEKRYSQHDLEGFTEAIDESTVKLASLFRNPKDKLEYTYDFGDNWQHTVLLEKILKYDDAPSNLPVCIKGVRACPLEDCGGVWGFHDMLKAVNDPKNPEYAEYKEWMGAFNPEAFDLEGVNRRLAGVKA